MVAITPSGWPLPEKRWTIRDADPEVTGTLAQGLGLSPTAARVMAARGLDSMQAAQAFLAPSLDELHSPFCFVQMEAAVDRLLSAIERGEKIIVHGDYDVDGVTGTVVLVASLRKLGGNVGYQVSHRLREGYGLHPEGVESAHEAGAGVLVAVDCGITALPAAARARELGLDLVIADHHQAGGEMPEAVAILNPCLPDSGYPEPHLAAVGVAFKLARGVLERHPKDLQGTALLKLVAVGTVADMVPLTGENRVITHYGLSTLRETVNPGMRALLELAGVGRSKVSATDVAFRLAPRINAAGRLGDASDAIEMFLAADPGQARKLANKLHQANSRRRKLGEQILEAALEQPPADDDPFVVAVGDGWHRGVIGIVASRLVEHWGRPALVISVEEDAAFGSARSLQGFDLYSVLSGVEELFEEFGGHQQAAGMRLPTAKVEALRHELLSIDVAALDRAREDAGEIECDDEIDLERLAVADIALELDRLAPFGVGNREPVFLCRNLRIELEPKAINDTHLKLWFRGADQRVEAIAWRRADLIPHLEGNPHLDAVAHLQMRSWAGRLRPQLELIDLRPAAA